MWVLTAEEWRDGRSGGCVCVCCSVCCCVVMVVAAQKKGGGACVRRVEWRMQCKRSGGDFLF